MVIVALLIMFIVQHVTGNLWIGIGVFAIVWPSLEALAASKLYKTALGGFVIFIDWLAGSQP